MGTRDAIIRIKLQPGQFNSAIRDMQSKVQSAGRKMGASLREPLKKGIEAGVDAARNLTNELGNALTTAATLGGAVSAGALARGAAVAEKRYLQLSNQVSIFSERSYSSIDAQRDLEAVAKRTNIPFNDLYNTMESVVTASKNIPIADLLERAASQARRLNTDGERIGQVYSRLVAKGLAKSANEAENLTEEIYRSIGALMGHDMTDILNPNDIGELAAFINMTGAETEKLFAILKFGGKDLSKDFGKMNEVIEAIGEKLGQSKGIKEMKKDMWEYRKAIDYNKDGVENFISILDQGPRAFEKMARLMPGQTAGFEMMKMMGGTEFIKEAQKRGKAGKEARQEWDLRVSKLKEQISSATSMQADRSKIEKEDAKHKETMIAKFDNAMNKLQMAMMKPEVIKSMNSLADDLPKLAESLSKIISFVAENPLLSLAGIGTARIGGAALSGFGRSLFDQYFGKGAISDPTILGPGGGRGRGGRGKGPPRGAGQIWGGVMQADERSLKNAKLGKVALSAGSVVMAADLGIAIGTAISKWIIQPMAKDAANARRDAMNKIERAGGAIRGESTEEKISALKGLSKAEKENRSGLMSFDTIVGSIMSVFGEGKSPIETYFENLSKINTSQKVLTAQIEQEMKIRKQAELDKELDNLTRAAGACAQTLNNVGGGKNNARGTGKLKTKPGSEPVKQSE